MNPRAAIDLNATVTTPENIQFGYQVAGPFRRLPAFILDLVIRGVLISGLFFALVCSGIVALLPFSGAALGVGMLLSYFFLDWFYGLAFETYWNGKTPGKYISKIQVISVDGRPISAYQATVRNFLRLGDMAPMMSLEVFDPDAPPIYWVPTGLVAILCMLVTRRFQRLGDLAAGTMVIVDERTWVPPSIQFEDPRVFSLAELIPANFRMSRSMGRAIALYCERRARMHSTKRLELSGILGKPLLRQFEFREDTSTDLLLCALYYREFVSKSAVPEAPVAKPPSWAPQAATPARPAVVPQGIADTNATQPVATQHFDSTSAPEFPPVLSEPPPILADAIPTPSAPSATDGPPPISPKLP